MTMRKIVTKDIFEPAKDHLGQEGDVWFGAEETVLRFGDGVTNGGMLGYPDRLTLGQHNAVMTDDGSMSIPGTIKSTSSLNLVGEGHAHTTWVGTVDDNDPVYADSVAYDSQGNVILGANYEYPGFHVSKMTPTGDLLWSKYLNDYSNYSTGVAVDAEDNIVTIGTNNGAVSVIKLYGANGTTAWAKILTDVVNEDDYSFAVKTDKDKNIVICGWINGQEKQVFHVFKMSGTDGALLWSKQLDFDDSTSYSTTLAIDAAGDIFVAGNGQGQHPDWISGVKLDGRIGSLVWSKTLFDPAFLFGPTFDQDFACGGATCDKDGNFFLSMTWSDSNPNTVTILGKWDKDGTLKWARKLGPSIYGAIAGHTVCDASGNVYVMSQYTQLENNYLDYGDTYPGDYHADRLVYLIAKFDTNGKTAWTRYLTKRQYMLYLNQYQLYLGWSTGGQMIDVLGDNLAICGTMFRTEDYSTNDAYYPLTWVMQIPTDGAPFDFNGWHFYATDLNIEWIEIPTIEIEPVTITDAALYVDNTTIQNSDNYDLRHYSKELMIETTGQTVTVDGSGIKVERETMGRFVTLGNFDGSEGGNNWNDVWFNGVARDANGNSYLPTGIYDQDYYGYLTKVNAEGKVEWQASMPRLYSYTAVASAIDPTTQDPIFVSLDGNEGFNVTRMGAQGGTTTSSTHIRSDQSGWYEPYDVKVDNKGRPVVVGRNNYGYTQYPNLPAGVATSGPDTLIVAKSVFPTDAYPANYGSWYVVVDDTRYNVDDVNNWYNLASTTNSTHGGTGSTWNVYINPYNNQYEFDLGNSGGSLYQVGDEIYISGDLVLGDAVVNKLTITVLAVDGGGSLTDWTFTSGVPQTEYVKINTSTGGTLNFSVGGPFIVQQYSGTDGFVWTPDWGRSLGDNFTTSTDYFLSVAVGSDNSVVAGGRYNSSGTNQTGIVCKFAEDGTPLWNVLVDNNDNYHTVRGVRIDVKGNVLVFSYADNGTSYVAKLSGDDGSMIWQAYIGGGNWSTDPQSGFDVDTEGFCYMGGRYYDGNWCYNDNYLIVKIDPDGNLVYMRDIASVYDIYEGYDYSRLNTLSVQNGRMSIALEYSYVPGDGYYQANLADLPSDGSGTGNYGPWMYRQIEYPYETNLNDSTDANAQLAVHVFYVDNLPFVPPAQYYGMQDKITGEIKAAMGGNASVASITFEDGSVMSTSGQDVPQVDQTKTNWSEYLVQLEDRGKHIYKWSGNVVIPTNDQVAFPVGATITIVTDQYTVYLYCDDNGTTRIRGIGTDSVNSSYSIDPYSMVTLLKVQKDTWMLSGGTFSTN